MRPSLPHRVDSPPVRIVVARCQVDYAGRLTAHLPMATRVLMIKADGSVLVHSDGGSYKPLNWMSPPCTLREGTTDEGVALWTVTSKAEDTLQILIEEVLSDTSHELGIDPGLQKDGVEKHLQELLAEHPATLAEGLTLVRREFPTAIGPVDLMCRDAAGASVAVEIKRRGEIDGVEQLTRYLELLNRDPLLAPVRGIFAAQEIKPQARVLAEDRGITCAVVDYDALRGLDDPATGSSERVESLHHVTQANLASTVAMRSRGSPLSCEPGASEASGRAGSAAPLELRRQRGSERGAGRLASPLAAASKKRSISTGNGSTSVEFFSAATSTMVCSSRSWRAAGVALMAWAACESFAEAWSSPSAVMIRDRRSRSASACRDIERFIDSGRATSLISTRSISIPQPAAGLSIMISSPSLSFSRLESRSSMSLLPMIDRRDVWATCRIANL